MNHNLRPLSWSQISSFHYNPEQWFRRYILNEKDPETKELLFGKEIGKKLETDPTFLPMIPRHSKMEYPFSATVSGIKLIGYADTFCDITNKKLGEYKTGKKEWDQKRVDEHGQLTMYALMNYISNKVKPEDVEITLTWMPTIETRDFDIAFVKSIEKNIKTFTTKRTMQDIIKFGASIKETVEEMQKYVDKHI